MKTVVLFVLAILTSVKLLNAEPIQFQSRETQTPLLELYTSEGCSSCPPAETWLSHQKTAAGLWTDFVPIAYHVDYWDYLGWRDPWSAKSSSERQRALAHSWGSGNIYTPEFVYNNREWSGWGSRKNVPGSETKVGVLSVTSTNGSNWQVSFVSVTSEAKYEVHAALLASGVISDVKAGENSGRRLTHDFIALTTVTKSLKQQDPGYRGEFVLDSKPKSADGQLALAVWVTRTGQLESLQATGGWLPAPSVK